MPDPLPNPALPENFSASAAAAVASARSPLERAMDAPSTAVDAPPRQDHDPNLQRHAAPHLQDPASFQSQLDRARMQDLGQQPSPAQQQSSQQPQQQQGDKPKPAIEPRRLNGRQTKQWNALAASKEQALLRVTELEGQLAQLQQAAQQTGASQQGQQQASSNQQLDLSKLPLDQLLSTHPELKRLQEERNTFYEEIKHTRVEADPEFKAKFDSQTNAIVGSAKRAAGGAADDIAKILSIQDPDQRAHALSERLASGNFSDASKQRILAANAQLDVVSIAREAEIASRKATWEHTQASRQQQAALQQQQRFNQLEGEFNEVVKQWADPEKGMPFVLNDPSNIISEARRLFSSETQPRALAEGAMKAAILPSVLQQWQTALDEIGRLQQQVQLLGGALPLDNGSSYVPPSSPPRAVTSHLDPGYVQEFDNRLQAARAADMAAYR